MDIVLLYTGGDKLLGTDDYVNKYVGCTPDAVEYLLDCGIKMLGIDTIGLDRPCFLMFKEFLTTKDKSKIWPCHFLGRRRDFITLNGLVIRGQFQSLMGLQFPVCR